MTSAAAASLWSCHDCSLLVGAPPSGHGKCPRCHAPLHHRKPNSLTRTWALLLTAVVLYIPANVLPVMKVISLGRAQADTIMSGVIYLFEHGQWPLAALIFFASVFVPLVKILALSFITFSVGRRSSWRPVVSTMGYSSSGCSSGGTISAGTSFARPVGVGKPSPQTMSLPGRSGASHG